MFYLLSILLYCAQIFSPDVRTLTCRYVDVATDQVAYEPERTFLVMDGGRVSADGDRAGHVLEIGFDLMSQDVQQYTYTVRHLDRNGQPDDLASVEYLEGFSTADIVDYATSFNTRRDYTHYSFRFPNPEMTLTRSGRYAVVVYESGYPDREVLCQIVDVVEPKVDIRVDVLANTDMGFNGPYQQLEVVVTTPRGFEIATPTDLSIVVSQNGRTDNAAVAPAPTYIEPNCLRWSHCRSLIFEGGNEYRHIDLFSRLMGGTNVDRIAFDGDDYHAMLFDTPVRTQMAYMHEYDADGQFLINAERTTDAETEAEYIFTHFILPVDAPYLDGEVYVGGEWNQNRMDYRSRMLYDSEHRCYYLSAPLKQGGYDFQYWFVPRGDKHATMRLEGSHWQTRNSYAVRVFYRPFGARYDELVGIWQ